MTQTTDGALSTFLGKTFLYSNVVEGLNCQISGKKCKYSCTCDYHVQESVQKILSGIKCNRLIAFKTAPTQKGYKKTLELLGTDLALLVKDITKPFTISSYHGDLYVVYHTPFGQMDVLIRELRSDRSEATLQHAIRSNTVTLDNMHQYSRSILPKVKDWMLAKPPVALLRKGFK